MRFLLAFFACGAAVAQNKAPGPVLGMNNFIHATEDLEKTVNFYREVFGLEKPAPPRPPNPAVPGLINAPGAQLQVQILRFPGSPFGFELTNFGPVERKPVQSRSPDSGGASLELQVRDLASVLSALKKAGAPMVSPTAFRDPDGFSFSVTEAAPGASIHVAVSDLTATIRFYRDLLGFELGVTMSFIQVEGKVPGTDARIVFTRFMGEPHPEIPGCRIPDPGCPAIALRVADLDGLLAKMKAAGVKVVSAGGVPAQFSPTIRNIFVEDPDGFHVELYEQQ